MHVTIQSDQSETTFPFQYAKIKNFYIYKDYKIFMAQKLNVIGSNTHIRGIYIYKLNSSRMCCCFALMTCTVMEFFI